MFKKIILLATGVFLICGFPQPMCAQEQAQTDKTDNVSYKTPTIQSLSRLYWALSKFEPDETGKIDDLYIDNFLFINQCDLYQEFADNEFEWKKIQDSGRTFLAEHKDSFSKRFEYTQPLRLGEYNLETQAFELLESYKIRGARRFEVIAEDINSEICNQAGKYLIRGYPKGLIVEMNRPFTLEKVPVRQEIAEQYVEDNMSNREKTLFDRYSPYQRNAYLVVKMKIFTYQKEVPGGDFGPLAKVLAVMEGYEIYADRDREELLFSENYIRKKTRSKMEIELKKRYQERLKKHMEEKKKAQEALKSQQSE